MQAFVGQIVKLFYELYVKLHHVLCFFWLNRNIQCGNMTSYWFSRWRPSAMLYLLWGNGGPPTKCLSWTELGPQTASSSDCYSSGDIAMYRLWRFGLKLPVFTPLFGSLWGMFPHMTSPIVPTPKRTVFGRKHVILAIHRKNQCDGSTWAQDREKRTG